MKKIRQVTRRVFLGQTALGTGALLLTACGADATAPGPAADGGQEAIDGGGWPDAGHGVADGGGGPDAGEAVADGGVTPTPQCLETEDNILGPFYRTGAPFRTALASSGDGQLLFVAGTVRGLAGQCLPLGGALLDVWQADGQGAYDNTSADFRFRGRLNADPSGAYAFQTILPGRYLNGNTYRPRHLHLRVSSPGFVLLTTQLYFADDPFLSSDPFVRPSLVVPLEHGAAGLNARFDIVLAPS